MTERRRLHHRFPLATNLLVVNVIFWVFLGLSFVGEAGIVGLFAIQYAPGFTFAIGLWSRAKSERDALIGALAGAIYYVLLAVLPFASPAFPFENPAIVAFPNLGAMLVYLLLLAFRNIPFKPIDLVWVGAIGGITAIATSPSFFNLLLIIAGIAFWQVSMGVLIDCRRIVHADGTMEEDAGPAEGEG